MATSQHLETQVREEEGNRKSLYPRKVDAGDQDRRLLRIAAQRDWQRPRWERRRERRDRLLSSISFVLNGSTERVTFAARLGTLGAQPTSRTTSSKCLLAVPCHLGGDNDRVYSLIRTNSSFDRPS